LFVFHFSVFKYFSSPVFAVMFTPCCMVVDLQDHDGIHLQLAVTHVGIIIFQNVAKINSFSWAKIRKLCFKRKKFVIKLHP